MTKQHYSLDEKEVTKIWIKDYKDKVKYEFEVNE